MLKKIIVEIWQQRIEIWQPRVFVVDISVGRSPWLIIRKQVE